MAKTDKVSFPFNRKVYTFGKADLAKAVKQYSAKSSPRDASTLKHRVRLPQVKTPVSLQWAIMALCKVPPQMEAASTGNIRGSYHPAQALSALAKLAPLGVKVESDAPNLRYKPFLTAKAKAELAKAEAERAKAERAKAKGKAKGKADAKAKAKGKAK